MSNTEGKKLTLLSLNKQFKEVTSELETQIKTLQFRIRDLEQKFTQQETTKQPNIFKKVWIYLKGKK